MIETFRDGKIEVRQSPIQGLGVFAVRDITAGEIVTEWMPERELAEEEVHKLPFEERKCVSQIAPNKYVVIGIPARYVNHSCDANTYAEGMKDMAVRNIGAGEEITADYRSENVPVSFTCHCGSPNCAHEIRSTLR